MKAIRLEEPKHFEYVEIADPGQPGQGQVLVRTHRMGICGTDLSGYLGKFPFFRYARIPGHELGVEVLAVGSHADWQLNRRFASTIITAHLGPVTLTR